jgi:hypothetical protein
MFRPDMKMLEMPEYALYEIHESGNLLIWYGNFMWKSLVIMIFV